MTPSGIETATFRFVAKHPNHCATAVPRLRCTDLYTMKDTGMLISFQPDPTEKQLKGRYFSSDAGVIAAAETWLDGQTSEFFECLEKVRV